LTEAETQHTDESPELSRDLIEKLKARDPSALAALDGECRNALLRFCWSYLGEMTLAEDAVQEVWRRILAAGEIPDHIRPWLYKVARNYCLNMLRDLARRRDRARLPSGSQMEAELTGQLSRLVRREQGARLAELVASLSDAQREVLHLRYVEELSRAEIAEVLELPESVVKSRLFEGLNRLRELGASMADT